MRKLWVKVKKCNWLRHLGTKENMDRVENGGGRREKLNCSSWILLKHPWNTPLNPYKQASKGFLS